MPTPSPWSQGSSSWSGWGGNLVRRADLPNYTDLLRNNNLGAGKLDLGSTGSDYGLSNYFTDPYASYNTPKEGTASTNTVSNISNPDPAASQAPIPIANGAFGVGTILEEPQLNPRNQKWWPGYGYISEIRLNEGPDYQDPLEGNRTPAGWFQQPDGKWYNPRTGQIM